MLLCTSERRVEIVHTCIYRGHLRIIRLFLSTFDLIVHFSQLEAVLLVLVLVFQELVSLFLDSAHLDLCNFGSDKFDVFVL